MLGFLRKRAIDAVEQCDELRYQRTFETTGRPGIVTISPARERDAIVVCTRPAESHSTAGLENRIRVMLDLDADMEQVESTLDAAGLPAQLTNEMSGVRVPGAWDPFELGVRAILGQQITVQGARTLAGRLCRQFGRCVAAENRMDEKDDTASVPRRVFPVPDALAEADIGAIGMPVRRAETIRAFSRAVAEGRINLGVDTNHDEIESQLLALRGIGRWTVGYMRMRAFKDADAFPHGDVALVKAARSLDIASNAAELEQASQRWRPWRAYVAVRLWRSLSRA